MPRFAGEGRSAGPTARTEDRHISVDESAAEPAFVQALVDALTRLVEDVDDPRIARVIQRVRAPVAVSVSGRAGVGRRTVAAALAGAGVCLTEAGQAAELHVRVVAEAVKPEDLAVGPALTILNKADLTGSGAGGPLARAHHRAAACRARTGVPTVPMVGLLADVRFDEELLTALGVLATEPADLTSTDAFVQSNHRLPAAARDRLLATLDRFGLAHAVLALQRGVDAVALPALLRRVSELDRVVARVDAAAAPARYRRVRAALTELGAVAAHSDRVADFLAADDTVLAVMGAAVAVVEAAGLTVDHDGDARAHLRRAGYWRHYSRGPVDPLHRACGADISRGSLRMFERAR